MGDTSKYFKGMAEKHLLKMHNRLVIVEWNFPRVFCLSKTTSVFAVTKTHATLHYRNQSCLGFFFSQHCSGSHKRERERRKNFFSKFTDSWIMFDNYHIKDLQALTPY